MKVFNVTNQVLTFRGRDIQPGGSSEFPELDRFLPDRERAMVAKRIIAVGKLPAWYTAKVAMAVAAKKLAPVNKPSTPGRATVKAVDYVKLEGSVQVKATEKKLEPVAILPEKKETPPPLPEEKKLSDGWVEKPISSKSKLK